MTLEVDDIVTFYGKAQVLYGISLRVEEGDIVALFGGNGAGKSTTLLTIAGVVAAGGGRVLYKNKLLTGKPPASVVKFGIALCPEGRELFPDMTVEANLRLGAFLRKDREGIAKDFQRVYRHFPKLSDRRQQIVGSLSGGEQQMVAIGRSLMSRPSMLMLDEPSLGLSPILVDKLFRIIRDINEEGTSILLVEQNVGAALQVVNKGYVLETGRIVFSGTRDEIISNDRVKEAYLGG